jgi:hypothetical protein
VLVALSWAGLVTRRVSTKGFEVFPTSQPPFPSLLGAIPVSPPLAALREGLTAVGLAWDRPAELIEAKKDNPKK